MKRIKSVNGYSIYQATARDTEKYNVTEGVFYIYFSSDVRDFGIANSDPDWEADTLENALEWCNSSNYAKAKEIVEADTTAATFESIAAVEKQLDAGIDPEEVNLEETEEEETDPDARLDENTRHCKHIAQELDEYVNGNVRRCPDCNETICRDWNDVGDAFKCPECGAVSDPDDWEQLSVWDFLNDVYNVEFTTTGRGVDDYRGVRVMVACGGPNIYLDTMTKDVELYWWTEKARWPISYAAVEALDEWGAEYWGCM